MNSDLDIHELLRSRRSPRAFDPECDVTRAEIERVLEAARWTPSCFNEQPWHYIVCERARDEPAWAELLDSLAEANRRWAHRAPVLIAVLMKMRPNATEEIRRLAFYDTGAASLSLCLQAHSQGLAAHQIGGFEPSRVRQAFSVPLELEPLAVIAVGRAGSPDLLESRARERELAPRVRRPLTDFVAFGHAPRLS